MSKILDKTDTFLLNYCYVSWETLFIGTQCINGNILCLWNS